MIQKLKKEIIIIDLRYGLNSVTDVLIRKGGDTERHTLRRPREDR